MDDSNRILLQLKGGLFAPVGPDQWKMFNDTVKFIEFEYVTGLYIRGFGLIDARGKGWWDISCRYHPSLKIVPYLRGQHLYGFIDGTKPAPPPTLAVPAFDTTAVIPNPEFYTWHTQDQMILSALISSLSETILAHVVKCTTSRDVWICLERMFTSQSRARSMQLHHQLSTLKKGDSSMADFYHKFTSLADTLATIDQPLKDFDLVSFFLAGLGSDYDALVTAIQQRRGDVTLDELYGDFLSHELRLAQHQPTVDLSLASANFANRSSSNRGGRGGRSSNPPNSGRSFSSNQQRQHRGRGRGRGPYNNSSRPTCQVCSKPGHTALTCYHRFDNSYTVETPPNMQALLATLNYAPDPNWLWIRGKHCYAGRVKMDCIHSLFFQVKLPHLPLLYLVNALQSINGILA
uniref:Retrotransposon gag domain-containing protein n=1 Tax=Fagus sylvatica TaxID=28930 RepID=A0A2N9GIG9_FAGSY